MASLSGTHALLPLSAGSINLAAARSEARGTVAPIVPSSAVPISEGPPGAALEVPKEFADRLVASMGDGIADAKLFAERHAPSQQWRIPEWALLKMKWPPKTDVEELKYLHDVAKSRTPQGIERAQFWSSHGLDAEWNNLLKQYTAKAAPAQAKAAQALLDDALMTTNTATQIGKAGAARQRPFVVDPTLEVVIDKPGNSPSYPSGHTSASFAAALVLSHLMPDRKDEFLGMAREASWARIYGGVHFPTDVLAGAKMASTITSYLTSISKAKPITGTGGAAAAATGAGTAQPGATGVTAHPATGAATVLPFGSRLAGDALPGAVALAG